MSTRIPPEFHRYRKGQNQPMAKLTAREVIRIREQYATDKFTQDYLAMCYGVNARMISKIVTGANWKSVGGPLTRRGRGPWTARDR